MSRLATDAERLAVENAGGGEVTQDGLALACAMVQAVRMAEVEADELRDWREQR